MKRKNYDGHWEKERKNDNNQCLKNTLRLAAKGLVQKNQSANYPDRLIENFPRKEENQF